MSIGTTFPQGFMAAGVACGLKKTGALDLALVASTVPATAAAMFTRNVVRGHSLQVSQKNVASGTARATVINAGCANSCLAQRGWDDAVQLTQWVGQALGCAPEAVLPSSTGVIGVPLDMEKMHRGIQAAVAALSPEGGAQAAQAIMTTDTRPKTAQKEILLDGAPVRIGAMAKGSGMIHINLATMISVITTDQALTPAAAQEILHQVVEASYNHVTVDGDTSCCDQVTLLASGLADSPLLDVGDPRLPQFAQAVTQVATEISRALAADGEGATKLLTILVEGAPSWEAARKIAKAIAHSPLCKTAAYGKDANWGRVLTAAGYSGADFDPERCDLYIGDIMVCRQGGAQPFSEEEALKILEQDEVVYRLVMHQGDASDFMWTCDLTHDYITINGSYRS